MYKHICKDHEGIGTNVEFDWRVLSKHNKPLQRQLAEAIQIDKKASDVNLNSKNEYFKHSNKRIDVVQDTCKEQCEYCGRKFHNLKELENHEIDQHIRYSCKQCQYHSFGRRDLNQHVKSNHESQ